MHARLYCATSVLLLPALGSSPFSGVSGLLSIEEWTIFAGETPMAMSKEESNARRNEARRRKRIEDPEWAARDLAYRSSQYEENPAGRRAEMRPGSAPRAKSE
jgi:hypothetical protein